MNQEVFPRDSWCLGSHTMTLSTRYADISRCTAVAPDVSPTVNNSPLQPSTSISPLDEPPAEALQLYSLYSLYLQPLQLYRTSSTLYNPLQHPSDSSSSTSFLAAMIDHREDQIVFSMALSTARTS